MYNICDLPSNSVHFNFFLNLKAKVNNIPFPEKEDRLWTIRSPISKSCTEDHWTEPAIGSVVAVTHGSYDSTPQF